MKQDIFQAALREARISQRRSIKRMLRLVPGKAVNANLPNNVIVRDDLTSYAFGIIPELGPILADARRLAPVVPTGSASGAFNKFEITQAFADYSAQAERAIGGKANEIAFLASQANYNLKPYGLRISLDEHEEKLAGIVPNAEGQDANTAARMNNAKALLEQGKVRTLTVNCATAYAISVVKTIKAALPAEKKLGNWGSPDVDPIAEINQIILKIFQQTGMVPNQLDVAFGAWALLIANPKVVGRMGTVSTAVTMDKIQILLLNPNIKINIVMTGALASGGIANPSAKIKDILGGSVLCYYSSAVPTQYDPSAFKTFSTSSALFTGVFEYPEVPHQRWFENDWDAQVQVVSSLLAGRIDVAGAYEAIAG